MDRRIFGLENEYGIAFSQRGIPRIGVEELADLLFDTSFLSLYGHRSVFLRNGGRFYIDHGGHPEYSTAECDSLRQLIAQEKAGERILEGLSVATERVLRAEGLSGDFYVLKNNVDYDGNTYGTHENYLIGRESDFGDVVRGLMPFLVTRPMIAGSGRVLRTGRDAAFCFSQRAEHMEEPVGWSTTHDRAIITCKDETHADKEQFRRLHIIVGDANMSETTTLLKVGATDLVLRMIEDGVTLPSLSMPAAVPALRALNRDLTGMTPVSLEDGRRVPAIALQETYLSEARTWAAARGLQQSDPIVARVLELWGRTLTAVRTRDFSTIDRDVDWAIKLRMIESYRARHDLPLTSPRVAQLDLGYHDVRRTRGLYYRMQARGMVNRVLSDIEILEATVRPPQSTRARLRGDFIRRAQETGRAFTADWGSMRVDDGAGLGVACPNPFVARNDSVEALIRSM